MKKPITSWQKVAGTALPEWNKQAIVRFGDKFASPLVLMESPEWLHFSSEQNPEWDARPINCISGKADPATSEQHITPPGVPTKALLAFAERSADYFHNYSCTTYIYAAKSYATLRGNHGKFTIGTVWSIF